MPTEDYTKNNLTPQASLLLNNARTLALRRGNKLVEVTDLAMATLDSRTNNAGSLLKEFNVIRDNPIVYDNLSTEIIRQLKTIGYDHSVVRVLDKALEYSLDDGKIGDINTGHILYALASEMDLRVRASPGHNDSETKEIRLNPIVVGARLRILYTAVCDRQDDEYRSG